MNTADNPDYVASRILNDLARMLFGTFTPDC